MSSARYLIGDTRDRLRELPDASVDLVLSSPPFLALRSYLPADHPDKAREIGSESTPGAFLDVLLDVVVELRRVLAPHGSLCFELGDTYSGSNESGWERDKGEYRREVRSRRSSEGALQGSARDLRNGWPLAKSLCMVPQSFAWALAYGRNPWTGRELEPWRVRNLIAWCRPNPPVGALGDKFRPATSFMTVACTGGKRYFDLDAVREPYSEGTLRQYAADADDPLGSQRATRSQANNPASKGMTKQMLTHAGAPPLDYWVIPTHPYPGSHYATWPPDLCVRPVKAMCPERVCRICGRPSERITETFREVGGRVNPSDAAVERAIGGPGRNKRGTGWFQDGADTGTTRTTLGWTDCGCCWATRQGDPEVRARILDDCADPSHWRRGVVLDPFGGSGTTAAVAVGHGRDAILIDLDYRNYELALERVGGLFLGPPEYPASEGAA